MKFYLYEEQYGYGCDYTIDCGKRLRLLEGASGMQHALKMATTEFTNRYGDVESMIQTEGERRIERAVILAVDDEAVIDVDALVAARRAAKDEEARRQAVEKEKAELERLKKKYGD